MGLGSDETDTQTQSSETCSDGNEPPRCIWTQNSILKLINLYKKYVEKFNNSTIRNDKVWQMIANDIETYTALQCKNKFKYLKQKYMEKKDNMGSKQTGAKAIAFSYFEEFDEIFGKKDNAVPLAVASTSASNEEKENVVQPKKRKRSALESQLNHYEQHLKSRELAREKRHSQILERQDRALEILEKLANMYANKNNE